MPARVGVEKRNWNFDGVSTPTLSSSPALVLWVTSVVPGLFVGWSRVTTLCGGLVGPPVEAAGSTSLASHGKPLASSSLNVRSLASFAASSVRGNVWNVVASIALPANVALARAIAVSAAVGLMIAGRAATGAAGS